MSNWRLSMPTAEAYWLGKVLFDLHHNPDDLAHYRRDPQEYLRRYPLTSKVTAAISENDVAALYECGVNPYLLRAHCIGMGIPEAVSLAALRGIVEQPNG